MVVDATASDLFDTIQVRINMGLGSGPNPNGTGEGHADARFTREPGDPALQVPPRLEHALMEGAEWEVHNHTK